MLPRSPSAREAAQAGRGDGREAVRGWEKMAAQLATPAGKRLDLGRPRRRASSPHLRWRPPDRIAGQRRLPAAAGAVETVIPLGHRPRTSPQAPGQAPTPGNNTQATCPDQHGKASRPALRRPAAFQHTRDHRKSRQNPQDSGPIR